MNLENFELTETTNSIEFSTYIESVVRDGNYIDSIVEFCKKNYVDIEDIKNLIHPTLKEKIRAEAMSTGLMKSLGSLNF